MPDFATHMGVDFDAIIGLIRGYAKEKSSADLCLLNGTLKPYAWVIDRNSVSHRVVFFRTVPHTNRTLASITKIGPGIPQSVSRVALRRKIARVLKQVDPAMLVSLRHILVIDSWDDLYWLAETYNLDIDTVPETLTDGQENLSEASICTFWRHADAIIVNARAVLAACPCLADTPVEAAGENYEVLPLLRIAAKDYFWYPLLKAIRLQWHYGGIFTFPWDKDRRMTDEANYADAKAYTEWAIQSLDFN